MNEQDTGQHSTLKEMLHGYLVDILRIIHTLGPMVQDQVPNSSHRNSNKHIILYFFNSTGPGVTSVGSGGFVPYPGYDYFRNDLWYFNFSTNLWIEITYPEDHIIPDPRVDMVFLLLGDVIFLHGDEFMLAVAEFY